MPRGRYAPSPTGEMHLGNASSALLAWLSIRSRGGAFVMRMEDLDRNRSRSPLAKQILDDLAWFGIDWDEGPDCGGPHAPYDQWPRLDLYRDAFVRLRDAGRLYPCFCSRKDIAAAASAPQLPGEERRYPGTCRSLEPEEAKRRIQDSARYAWRFRADSVAPIDFDDLVRGRWSAHGPACDDFVVHRSDDVPAYQLAVVVDDAAMGITEVIRGDDLLASTPRQLVLYQALDLVPPVFGHVPLLLDTEGVRFSKRQEGITLREMREAGWTPERIVGRLAHLLGLRPAPEPVAAGELIEGFSFRDLSPAPDGIVVDPSGW